MSKAFRLTIFLLLLALTSCQQKPSKEEQARNMEEFMMRNGYEWTQLYKTKTGHLTATLKINGQNAVMLLDTGGGATVLDYKQMDHFGLKARATHRPLRDGYVQRECYFQAQSFHAGRWRIGFRPYRTTACCH